MNLGLSLGVFDQTQSTWLIGIFGAISMLPGITLPILFGPVIDRVNRKRVIVALDAFSGLWYLAFLWYIRRYGFVYAAYLGFSFVTGCIWSVYNLAYNSLYPDLIPKGFEQKGYAVSGVIYPLATTLITPLAALLYAKAGVEVLILAEGVFLLIASGFEAFIDYRHEKKETAPTLKQYVQELREGFLYLKKEKGMRNIFGYMSFSSASGNGVGLMAMAHFQTANGLTTAMYGLLTSAETIGRLVGSAVHYLFKIPEDKRYWLTVRVYAIYELCDGVMLFMAYPVMIVLRFVCGFLGSQTAAIRQAATQKYLPSDMRGRVYGLFDVLVSLSMMAVQLLVGAMGEVMSYPMAAAALCASGFVFLFALIVRNKKHVEPIYNYEV